MKLPFDRDYFKISLYAASAAITVCFAVFIMANIDHICRAVWNFIKISLHLAAPLIIGIVIAFLLDPMTDFYEKRLCTGTKKKGFGKRYCGTAASFITVFLVLVLLGTALYKGVGAADIGGISDGINSAAEEFFSKINEIQKSLSHMGVLSYLNGAVNSVIEQTSLWARRFALAAAQSVSSVGSAVVKVGIGFAAAFYFLLEKERMLFRLKDAAYTFFPKRAADCMVIFFNDVNTVFSGYVAGQLTDAVIMAGLFSFCFWIGGIKYAFVIGIISGFFNLIPYIGAVSAFILSSLVALVGGTPGKALYAAAVVIVVQQLDSAVISPRVVGRSVKLHPVMVIFALSVFGSLFGLAGMVVAVPVMALIKLNFDRLYEYKAGKRRL